LITFYQEVYFTRPSPPSSGYGSSPPKFDHSDEDQIQGLLNCEKNDVSQSRMTRDSDFSSFKETTKLTTFQEDQNDMKEMYNTLSSPVDNMHGIRQPIGRSLSFGGQYEERLGYKKHPETGRVRRLSEVTTNLEDDIRILDEEHNSIMNLMNEFCIGCDT